jgi:hypothetical protein
LALAVPSAYSWLFLYALWSSNEYVPFVYGETGHLGDNCPETQEDASYINNNNRFHPQQTKTKARIHDQTIKEVIISMVTTTINLLLLILPFVKLKSMIT